MFNVMEHSIRTEGLIMEGRREERREREIRTERDEEKRS